MNIFEKKPKVNEVQLKREYRFMYESFVVSTQHELFLLLEEQEGRWAALKFEFLQFKYGYPNDESLGAHPMSEYGLGFYGFLFSAESPPSGTLRYTYTYLGRYSTTRQIMDSQVISAQMPAHKTCASISRIQSGLYVVPLTILFAAHSRGEA